jgi:iron complex transport system permease protein
MTTSPPDLASSREDVDRGTRRSFGNKEVSRFLILFSIGSGVLILGVLLDTRLGIVDMSLGEVWRALTVHNGSQDHVIIWDLRFPRALVASLVGLSLAVSGVIMQALMRNPLASPKLTGVSDGGAFAVVLAFLLLPSVPLAYTPFVALAGGLIGGSLVLALSLRSLVTPVRLALAGFATAVFLASMTTGLLLMNRENIGVVYFWLAGGVAGRTWRHVWVILPFALVGIISAQLLSRQLDILTLGEDVAKGLGLATKRFRIFLLVVAVLLAAAAVAVAGPIAFVGLIIPHIGRFAVGNDHRLLIPLSAMLGAVLVVWADIIARYIRFPLELPVGIVIAVLGGPFFLFLARRYA